MKIKTPLISQLTLYKLYNFSVFDFQYCIEIVYKLASFYYLDKPSPPLNLKVKEVSKESVDLIWESPESDGGAPITGYIVDRRDVSKTSFISAGKSDSNTCYLKVSKLVEGNEYIFRVAAENEIGQSEWTTMDKPVKAKSGFGKCVCVCELFRLLESQMLLTISGNLVFSLRISSQFPLFFVLSSLLFLELLLV